MAGINLKALAYGKPENKYLYNEKRARSDVLLFKIVIDKNVNGKLLTPFEPGGVHKPNPYAN